MVTRSGIGLLLQVNRLSPVDAVPTVLPVAALAREHLPLVVILAHARFTLGVVHDSNVGGTVMSQDVPALGRHALGPVAAPQGNRKALGHFARAALDRHCALAVELKADFGQVRPVASILAGLAVLADHRPKILHPAVRERGDQFSVAIYKQICDAGTVLAGVAFLARLPVSSRLTILAGCAILSGRGRMLGQERLGFQSNKLAELRSP